MTAEQDKLQSDALYKMSRMLHKYWDYNDLDLRDIRRLVNGLNPDEYKYSDLEPVIMTPNSPPVVPTSTQTGYAYAIDLASHQGLNVDEILRVHQPDHVICHMYSDVEASGLDRYTAFQWTATRRYGATPGGYMWAFGLNDYERQLDSVAELLARESIKLPVWWLDLEPYLNKYGQVIDPGPDLEWLDKAVNWLVKNGQVPGFYTAGYWWNSRAEGSEAFKDSVYLWYANPDGVAEIGEPGFGGWTLAGEHVVAKQWSWKPVDRDVMFPAFAGK